MKRQTRKKLTTLLIIACPIAVIAIIILVVKGGFGKTDTASEEVVPVESEQAEVTSKVIVSETDASTEPDASTTPNAIIEAEAEIETDDESAISTLIDKLTPDKTVAEELDSIKWKSWSKVFPEHHIQDALPYSRLSSFVINPPGCSDFQYYISSDKTAGKITFLYNDIPVTAYATPDQFIDVDPSYTIFVRDILTTESVDVFTTDNIAMYYHPYLDLYVYIQADEKLRDIVADTAL